jgi:hypothetical protein
MSEVMGKSRMEKIGTCLSLFTSVFAEMMRGLDWLIQNGVRTCCHRRANATVEDQQSNFNWHPVCRDQAISFSE